jgi:hypothetical protein
MHPAPVDESLFTHQKPGFSTENPGSAASMWQFGNSSTGYMKTFKTGVDPFFRIRISLAPTLALPLGIDAVLCVVE